MKVRQKEPTQSKTKGERAVRWLVEGGLAIFTFY